eukprot:461861-Pelagomonas_calceolata.AAC.1
MQGRGDHGHYGLKYSPRLQLSTFAHSRTTAASTARAGSRSRGDSRQSRTTALPWLAHTRGAIQGRGDQMLEQA